MILLLLLHVMVGYVELGTDSWIAKITGSIMASGQSGLMLLVYTSGSDVCVADSSPGRLSTRRFRRTGLLFVQQPVVGVALVLRLLGVATDITSPVA